MTIRGLIYVPFEGDQHGLLDQGLGGAQPPMAYQSLVGSTRGAWIPATPTDHQHLARSYRKGLIVGWDGLPVVAGLVRLHQASIVCDGPLWPSLQSGLVPPHRAWRLMQPDLTEWERADLLKDLKHLGFCELVMVGHMGLEVTL